MAHALPFWSRLFLQTSAETKSAPPLKRRGGPVFVQDAITPWGGETMLLSELRRQALDAMTDDEPR